MVRQGGCGATRPGEPLASTTGALEIPASPQLASASRQVYSLTLGVPDSCGPGRAGPGEGGPGSVPHPASLVPLQCAPENTLPTPMVLQR